MALSPSAWQIRCTHCGRTRRATRAGVFRFGANSRGKRVIGWCNGCWFFRFAAIETALDPNPGETGSILEKRLEPQDP